MSASDELNLDVTSESLAAEVGEILDFVQAACSSNLRAASHLHVPRPMAPVHATEQTAQAAFEQELNDLPV